jgi:hypothetical protein
MVANYRSKSKEAAGLDRIAHRPQAIAGAQLRSAVKCASQPLQAIAATLEVRGGCRSAL